MNDSLIMLAEELAAVTGGVWSNPSAIPVITRFAVNPLTTSSGDLLITTNKEQWERTGSVTETQRTLDILIRKGSGAAIVRRSSLLDGPINLLRVDDTYKALVAIATAARDKAKAKRVLVTGTEGKTGFKVQFHHLASEQISINARLDSNNMERAICTALANTKCHHALSVIEVAVPHKRLGIRRSQLVRPELCVITEIGYEHLAKHGDIKELIQAKASVVSGLMPGGCCLVKSNPRYFQSLCEAIRSFHEAPIFTFGERIEDLGRLISATFAAERYGWQVQAEIDGKSLSYFLPLVEQHAPLSSVGVLTAIHLLHLDVEQAAARFASLVPFQTSGRFYELPTQRGTYQVYDQSHRSYLLGLEDFFRTAALLSPRPGGRKVLVLGHVYDEQEYGPLVWELIPPKQLRSMIDAGGFDQLYTVGKREEFRKILNATMTPWEHFALPQDLVVPLHQLMRANDLLLVKGDQNEKMFALTDGLRAQLSSRDHGHPMAQAKRPAGCLVGLQPLTREDIPRFKDALSAGKQLAWGYYVPFMLSVNHSPRRTLLWTIDEGSVCLFNVSHDTPSHLDLYSPPFPGNAQVLRRCLERANDHNSDRSARIYWIDEQDMVTVKALGSVQIKIKELEYLYSPQDLMDLSGGGYRTVRRNVIRIANLTDLEVRAYRHEDGPACLRLLKQWEATQGLKYQALQGSSYTRACLQLEPLLPNQDLYGEVVLIAGEIRAFAFGGEIRPGLGCFFVTKCDTGIQGLSYYARHHFLTGMASYPLVNDSSDGGSAGLQQLKQSLRPRRMHIVYKAKQRS
jgi:UDP-N-acetylmuramyl pentapeptide synthase